MSLKPNANVCLVFDGELERLFIDFTKNHYADIAQDYCLGNTVFPHVSVNHLHLENDEQLDALQNTLPLDSPSVDVEVFGFNQRFSPTSFTTEFIVKKTPALLDVLAQVTNAIAALGLTPLNPHGDAYHPHITICKVPYAQTLPAFDLPSEILRKPLPTRLVLGKSDGIGQLLSYSLKNDQAA